MKAVVAAFNQEKALVGAFSVITNLWMEPFEALVSKCDMRGVDLYMLQVRMLARNPDKVPKVLATVFDEAEVEKHQENVHVVKVSNIISTHYLHRISTQYLLYKGRGG